MRKGIVFVCLIISAPIFCMEEQSQLAALRELLTLKQQLDQAGREAREMNLSRLQQLIMCEKEVKTLENQDRIAGALEVLAACKAFKFLQRQDGSYLRSFLERKDGKDDGDRVLLGAAQDIACSKIKSFLIKAAKSSDEEQKNQAGKKEQPRPKSDVTQRGYHSD